MNILLGLTTTFNSDWRKKIYEISSLGITEVALFATGTDRTARKELYQKAQEAGLETVPFVHLRSDFDKDEISFLEKTFDTKIFNFHSLKNDIFPFEFDLHEYYPKIFLENSEVLPDEDELEQFAGLCIDFAHWENEKRKGSDYPEKLDRLIKKHNIGCAHISAVLDEITRNDNKDGYLWEDGYDSHQYDRLSQFDYLKDYYRFMPDVVALELENSFKEQLIAKEYIENNLLSSHL